MKRFGEDVDRCLLLRISKDQELWLGEEGDLANLDFLEVALMEVAWQNSCAMIEQRGKEEEGGYLYPHSKWSRCSFRGAG